MPDDRATPLLERLQGIRARAQDYFEQVGSELSGQPYSYSDPWAALSPTLKDVSQAISAELAQLGPDLAEAVALSPLLSDVDQRNVGHDIKGMRAALRLRQYEQWDQQLHYEEDVCRGTTPAGERAVSPLQPAVAKEAFGTFADRLQQCIELMPVPPTSEHGEPQAPTAPATGVVDPVGTPPNQAKRSPASLILDWCHGRRESQRTLARKSGISPNTLRKIMKGQRVRSEKIAAVAEILDCDYKDLLP